MVSDEDVATIARDYLTDWESLRPFLGLSYSKGEVIRKSYPADYRKQKHECLKAWKEMKGNAATYSALITAAQKARNHQLADVVRATVSGTYINVCWEGWIS